MAHEKKVSFRLTETEYANLNNIFMKYQSSCPTLTLSDFLRNLILSICVKATDENKIDNK